MAQEKMSREARNSMRKKNNERRKAQRRLDAEERQKERDRRSDFEQLVILDHRPGESQREKNKLLKRY